MNRLGISYIAWGRAVAMIVAGALLSLGVVSSARAMTPLDPSFGQGGISFPGIPNAAIYGLAQDGQDRILVSGTTGGETLAGRLIGNGSLDLGFAGAGYVEERLGFVSTGRGIARQHDGKIVIAGGDEEGRFLVARYLSDGSLDPSFGNGGRRLKYVGFRGEAQAVAVTPGGRILVAGYAYGPLHHWKAVVLAFHPDGSPDRRFRGDGRTDFITSGVTPIEFEAMQLLPSGRILLAGEAGGDVMLVRLLANGDLDRSFSGDGLIYFDLDGDPACPCADATGLALDAQGRAIVGVSLSGPKAEASAVLRFRPDGRLDRSFGRRGVARAMLGTRLGTKGVAVQGNGKIVSAGFYNVPNTGEARVAVVRFLPDGRLDPEFGHHGFFIRDFGVEGIAYAALAQRDGRVVVAGRANRDPFEGDAVYETAEPFLIRFRQ